MADSINEDIQESAVVQQATGNVDDSLEQDPQIEETQDRSHVVQKSKWTDWFRNLFSSSRRRNVEQEVYEFRGKLPLTTHWEHFTRVGIIGHDRRPKRN